MRPGSVGPGHPIARTPMLDAIFIAAGLGFFALSLGYVSLCESL
jgi:hypothetical protein